MRPPAKISSLQRPLAYTRCSRPCCPCPIPIPSALTTSYPPCAPSPRSSSPACPQACSYVINTGGNAAAAFAEKQAQALGGAASYYYMTLKCANTALDCFYALQVSADITPSPSITPSAMSNTPTPSITPTGSASSTLSPFGSPTATPTLTPTPTPFCPPARFQRVAAHGLAGTLLGMSPAVATEQDCASACCLDPRCEGYSYAPATPPLACALYANVTGAVPNILIVSSVQRTVLDALAATGQAL